MKITIVLPRYGFRPVGGYKVQYEYANRLQSRGHMVTVVHPWTIQPQDNFVASARAIGWASLIHLTQHPMLPWFRIDPAVRLMFTRDLRSERIPDGDIIVATAWQTAEVLRHYPATKGKKLYMVFDYEFWMTADDDGRRRIADTYHAGFHMIATSPAVAEVLAQNDAKPTAYISCGISLKSYGVDVPITHRIWGTIGFPVRKAATKGTGDALVACQLLREKYGDRLKFTAFGPKRLPNIPNWVSFIRLPSDAQVRQFYNSVSIFLFPSHFEGWGLPGMEALACGAALVAADSVGLRDYAVSNETALVVPRASPELLARAVTTMLENDALRQRLASQGYRHVQEFTWEKAVDIYENLLANVV